MDRIGSLGVSWRNANAALLSACTLPRTDRHHALRELAALLEVEELVYLATCNRVELLMAGGAALPIGERRRRLTARFPLPRAAARAVRAREGEAAVEHLFLLATGLDSVRVGESEVAGQLRAAVAEAQDARLLGPALRAVMDEAFRIARHVRPLADGRVGAVSLADLAVARVLARRDECPGAVALVGVSPMTERAARLLAAQQVPLLVVNRTESRAREFAARHGAAARRLDRFRADPDPVAALIVATGAVEPIFDGGALGRLARVGVAARPPLIVDLGVPPNVAADAARAVGIERVTMDAVVRDAEASREAALEGLGEARALVDAAVEEYRRRAWTAIVDPAIVEMRRRFHRRAEAELDRALATELAFLDPTGRAAVQRWADRFVHRLAHLPSRGLRDLAAQEGPAAAAAFLGTAAPDLAAALRRRTRAASVAATEGAP